MSYSNGLPHIGFVPVAVNIPAGHMSTLAQGVAIRFRLTSNYRSTKVYDRTIL
jgi:hypothetical protein